MPNFISIHTHCLGNSGERNMAAEISDEQLGKTYLYHQLDEYPWDQDEEFQGGLRAILGSVQDPAQVEHLTLRAKCYYYARKSGTPVDFDGYKQWVESLRTGAPATNGTTSTLDATPTDPSAAQPAQDAGTSTEADVGGMSGMGNAPYSASFTEICDMIAEGKPIPGIKDIPDTILEGQASESQTQKRKKPWEKDGSASSEQDQQSSWMK